MMKAVFSSAAGSALKETPIPSAAPGEVLIKNGVIAANPKDFKLLYWFPSYVAVEGNDVAGYVKAVGAGVSDFKEGDKVAAFTKIQTADKYGAYAEYTVSPSNTVFHVDAAALPLAYMTAAIGLFVRLGLPTPTSPPSTAKPQTPILIWGGSTTVGVYAIQLAKLANLHVVVIAGAGGQHAKSYGADEVIDYRNKTLPELSSEIAKAADGKIRHVFDAVSENGTTAAIAEALQPLGGQITIVLPMSEEDAAALPKNAVVHQTNVRGAHSDDAAFAKTWFAKVGEWMENGTFRAQKVTVVPGGLAGVEEGLRRLKAGEVSSEKLVYIIAQTPGV